MKPSTFDVIRASLILKWDTMPNNLSLMKYAIKSVPGLADVGVSNGDGDGPRTAPRCMEGVWKKFQTTNFDMPNNASSMKYALK